MNYYHYTNGSHLAKIVKDGLIRTSKSFLDKKEKPAAWLTRSPEWDVACNVGIVKNTKKIALVRDYFFDEIETQTVDYDYMKKKIGMCRILINENLQVISWAKFGDVSGITWTSYIMRNDYSSGSGSPVDQWFCTFSGIPSKYWEGIEMFVDDQWVRWDGKLPIQEFVDLCLSYNGMQEDEEEMINVFPKKHAQRQIDFIDKYLDEIVRIWEANKNKKGYIQIYIPSDYKLYPSYFEFIEKRIKKTSFKPFGESETESYALVHFLWEATFIQYKLVIPYENQEYASNNNSNHN